jgi:hypothetical protein
MKRLLLFIALCFVFLLFCDEGEEKVFSTEDDTYHSNELSDILENLRKNPININAASQKELLQIPWLSEEDVDLMIRARSKGKIKNAKHLITLGIDEITVSDIEPYIIFAKSSASSVEQITRFEAKEKYLEEANFLKYYQRTVFKKAGWNLGFLTQKDEKEKELLDFYTYYLQYSSSRFLKKIILGKYRPAFGQGIIFAPSLGVSKTASATSTPIKNYNPLKPYKSSFEMWESEGVSANLGVGNVEFIPFFSKTKLDANVNDDEKITSFPESGLHVTDSFKDKVDETFFGSVFRFKSKKNEIGILVSKHNFDHEFEDSNLNNDYAAYSSFFKMNLGLYPMFGELSAADGKYAGILGIKFGESKFRQVLLLRYYEKYFPTWHGNPLSAQSSFDNEMGMYYGITLVPFAKAKMNIYFDIWKYPQTRYFEKMPSVGNEEFIQLELNRNPHNFRFTFKHKNKEKYISLDESGIRDFERNMFRVDWWQDQGNFRMKSRLEFTSEFLREDRIFEHGILAYQQIKYKTGNLEVVAQVSVYHTEVLIYMYENSIDGIMQNSIFSGDGIYSYLLFKYNVFKHFEMQFKISDELIEENKMRLYFQMITRF